MPENRESAFQNTYKRLAAPVLMLSPPGPLAERARAIFARLVSWT